MKCGPAATEATNRGPVVGLKAGNQHLAEGRPAPKQVGGKELKRFITK